MSPTRLGKGFWIVNSAEEVRDAAFSQLISQSPLHSQRDRSHMLSQFNRYAVLAYRTPQLYPQLLHIVIGDNMRITVEGTAPPNAYVLSGKPVVHDIEFSLDLLNNAVIYRVNPDSNTEFITWGFLELTHRNVAVEALISLGYEKDRLTDMSNYNLERLMFIEGHSGVILGTPCVEQGSTMIHEILTQLDPEIRNSFDNFHSLCSTFKRVLNQIQVEGRAYTLTRNMGHQYRFDTFDTPSNTRPTPEPPTYSKSYQDGIWDSIQE